MATQQPSAVRFFPIDHPAMAGTVRGRLEKRRRELLDEVMAANEWGDYCLRKGRVEGVDNAIQHCLDVENETTERNR